MGTRGGGQLLSIGYEQRTIDELVAILIENEVQVLVDVRLNAISRKPGFSKTALSTALFDAGIEYRHERRFGNPKDNREGFRRGHAAARRRYRNHLDNAVGETRDEIIDLAEAKRVALLCYERQHSECHRSCITDWALAAAPDLSLVEL